PTVIMVLMFLTFATDIFNIPDIQSKSIFVVGMVLIFPISFLMSLTIVATYLFFSQFSVFFMKKLKLNKRFYRKNTNMLWISNLI
ncbi:hypothetical protein ACTPEF_25110, partial [Clostridioides difficile]